MVTKLGRCSAAIVILLLLAGSAVAQQDDKKPPKAASLDGTTGLFRAWDAESLRKHEANLSIGYTLYFRDPGDLRFSIIPVGGSFGITDRFEVFGSVEPMRRVSAHNMMFWRVLPGRLPIPSWTTNRAAYFYNDAPFMEVPKATGFGDARVGGKFNLFSERRNDPLSVAVVGFVKIPTGDSYTKMNRGLTTGEFDGGWGFLFSKSAGRIARVHLNTMVNWVGNPERENVVLADLQHEFWYRGGAAIPNFGRFQAIAEIEGKTFFGSRTLGLNPASPLDLIVGLRAYPRDWIAVGAGYRASLKHMDDNPGLQAYPAQTHGLVAQVAFGKRRNEPPSVTCAVSNATIKQDETTTVRANAVDPDGDTLTYSWSTTGGKITGTDSTATFDATGIAPGKYTVTATVSDGKHQATCSSEITVIKKNVAPTVTCAPESSTITIGDSATVRATASDPNNDQLTYAWTINGQHVASSGPELIFGSEGREPGNYTVTVTVSDGELTATCSSTVTVQPKPNRQPTIECLTTSMDVRSGGTVQLQVRTSDPDNDQTTVTWTATGGTVNGSGETATFDATGLRAGTFTVTATVDDGKGGRASCSMTINVSERVGLTSEGKRGTAGGFGPGSARVDNVAKAALDDIAVRMQNDPRLRANIIGYTDTTRRDKGLGIKRAQNVANYLKSKGIEESRLTVTDGGTNNPIGDNKTVAGRKQNRRVEIELSPR
jgi:outer membrane protein OmpA-like peptidoglycan-associated protein